MPDQDFDRARLAMTLDRLPVRDLWATITDRAAIDPATVPAGADAGTEQQAVLLSQRRRRSPITIAAAALLLVMAAAFLVRSRTDRDERAATAVEAVGPVERAVGGAGVGGSVGFAVAANGLATVATQDHGLAVRPESARWWDLSGAPASGDASAVMSGVVVGRPAADAAGEWVDLISVGVVSMADADGLGPLPLGDPWLQGAVASSSFRSERGHEFLAIVANGDGFAQVRILAGEPGWHPSAELVAALVDGEESGDFSRSGLAEGLDGRVIVEGFAGAPLWSLAGAVTELTRDDPGEALPVRMFSWATAGTGAHQLTQLGADRYGYIDVSTRAGNTLTTSWAKHGALYRLYVPFEFDSPPPESRPLPGVVLEGPDLDELVHLSDTVEFVDFVQWSRWRGHPGAEPRQNQPTEGSPEPAFLLPSYVPEGSARGATGLRSERGRGSQLGPGAPSVVLARFDGDQVDGAVLNAAVVLRPSIGFAAAAGSDPVAWPDVVSNPLDGTARPIAHGPGQSIVLLDTFRWNGSIVHAEVPAGGSALLAAAAGSLRWVGASDEVDVDALLDAGLAPLSPSVVAGPTSDPVVTSWALYEGPRTVELGDGHVSRPGTFFIEVLVGSGEQGPPHEVLVDGAVRGVERDGTQVWVAPAVGEDRNSSLIASVRGGTVIVLGGEVEAAELLRIYASLEEVSEAEFLG